MRYEGKLIKWYDDKGFGFIRATADSKDVFLHVSEIQKMKRRPIINELVTYEINKDNQGRFRAINVGYQTSTNLNKQPSKTTFSPLFLTFILLFTAFIFERTINGFLPDLFPILFLGINLFIFLYYYQDKTAALKNEWRTPENTLHWFSLLGGWAGAYIAQKTFKHKHKKISFMWVYKLTVIINCGAIILYSTPVLNHI
jgi:uncharacterized membrane protein YsdA (DUF1294 family)/cold shock CspA family protein